MIERLFFIPIVAFVGIVLGLLLKGVDRILAARMQARVGPPLLQPFTDLKKLMMKENIVPKNAVAWLFNLMPFVALVSAVAILLYLPLFGFPPLLEGHGDLILIVYLFTFPALAMVIGGFASASPYATIGAQREMATMVGYEFPLAIAVVSIAWLVSISNPAVSAFSLSAIASIPVWGLVGPIGLVGIALLFIVIMTVMPGELGKLPFDAAEAETEIAGGILAEYSGRNLALFYLADAVKAVAMGSLVVALFLPWNIAETFGLLGINAILADAIFFVAKLFAVLFVGMTFSRVAFARLRITQIVKFYWGYATLIALLGLLLISLELIFFV